MDPKWLILKMVSCKGCNDKSDAMIGKIGYVSHHLGSLADAIELTILCAFVFKIGYFDAQIRDSDSTAQVGSLTYLPL